MTRRRNPKAPATAARPSPRAGLTLRISEPAWLGIGAASILLLLWSCRGALYGVPTADDYDFLYWLRFHPFSLIDSMGAPYYWRPLSRQLYFVLVAPILYTAPWLVTVLHSVLLVATSFFVYRIARRLFSPGVSVAIAVFPLLAEPTRTMLIWPTAAQYVLAALGTAVAVHAAVAGRRWTAGLAALAAILSHGAAAPVLYAFPLIAWFRTRRVRDALAWTGISLAVAAVWIGGHWLGREHGTGFFAGGRPDATLLARLAQAVGWTVNALLNLEDAHPTVATFAWGGYASLLALAALFFVFDPAARQRLRRAAPALVGAAAWILLCVFPLALMFPDWSSWRTPLAALGLGVLAAGLLGTARPWLSAGFVAILAATLFAAPLAPLRVTKSLPYTRSRMGFVRLVRLQRTVDGARRVLESGYPNLRRGASVAYWSRVEMTEVGFEREKAIRVWYGDSTITWQWLWEGGLKKPNYDAILTFEGLGPSSSVLLQPHTMDLVWQSVRVFQANHLVEADSLLDLVYRTQQPYSAEVAAWVVLRRSHAAYDMGNFARAESLNNVLGQLTAEGANYCALQSALELRRGNVERAKDLLQRCLTQDPRNDVGLRVLNLFRRMEAGDTAPKP